MYRHRIGCHKRYKPMTTIELKKLSRGRWTDSDCPTISLIMASYLLNFYNKNVFVFKNYQNTVKISKIRRFLTQITPLILLRFLSVVNLLLSEKSVRTVNVYGKP